MKTKLFTTFLLALYLLGIASAVNFAVSPASATFTPSVNSAQFTVTNTNSSILLNMAIPSSIQITGNEGYVATFNIQGDRTNVNASFPRTFTISPQSPIDFSKINLVGGRSGTFTISDGVSNSTFTLNIQNSFCTAGNRGNIDVSLDINNQGIFGDENTWYPTETIEVDVTVENSANEDLDDVIVEWGVYNIRTGEFIIDDSEKRFRLKEDDEETITIEFTLDPEDFDSADNPDDFVFFVKAYDDNLGESSQCDMQSEDITIARDDHLVVLEDIRISEPVQCGEVATVTATAWNIGDSDESDIYIRAFHRKLNLDQRIEVGDLDVFEDKKISFEIEVPINMTVSQQYFELSIYDEDNNIFESDDEVSSTYAVPINISGGCEVPRSVSLSSSVESDEVIAGQEATIRATIKNTGSEETTYQILFTNIDSWATLKTIEPRTLTLKAGETRDATITFIPDKSTEGSQRYKLQVAYGNLITETEGNVEVSPPKGFFNFTGFSISNILGNNGFIWAIAALNIILVVLIIVIAVRIARK